MGKVNRYWLSSALVLVTWDCTVTQFVRVPSWVVLALRLMNDWCASHGRPMMMISVSVSSSGRWSAAAVAVCTSDDAWRNIKLTWRWLTDARVCGRTRYVRCVLALLWPSVMPKLIAPLPCLEYSCLPLWHRAIHLNQPRCRLYSSVFWPSALIRAARLIESLWLVLFIYELLQVLSLFNNKIKLHISR